MPDSARPGRHGLVPALAGVGAALLLSACSPAAEPPGSSASPAGARLVQPADAHWTGDALPAAAHPTILVGSFLVCLNRPGEVRIDTVSTYGGDLPVAGFAVRPNPLQDGGTMLGSAAGTLEGNGLVPGPEDVTAVCDSASGAGSELVVQLDAGPATTKAQGLLVSYTSGGQPGELRIPHGLVMCMQASASDPACSIPQVQ